jgi:hypothetical protein
MRTPSEHDEDEGLQRTLRQWTVDAPLPPRFQEHVWARIASADAPPETSFREVIEQWLEVVLPRPKVAFGYVAALLALGLAAGSIAAQVQTNRLETSLSARYVHAVNPYP